MTRVRGVDHVDHAWRLLVASFGLTRCFGVPGLPSFAPDIAVEDVVVIRHTDGGAIAHGFAEGPAMHVELAKVIENSGSFLVADDAKATVVLV